MKFCSKTVRFQYKIQSGSTCGTVVLIVRHVACKFGSNRVALDRPFLSKWMIFRPFSLAQTVETWFIMLEVARCSGNHLLVHLANGLELSNFRTVSKRGYRLVWFWVGQY